MSPPRSFARDHRGNRNSSGTKLREMDLIARNAAIHPPVFAFLEQIHLIGAAPVDSALPASTSRQNQQYGSITQ